MLIVTSAIILFPKDGLRQKIDQKCVTELNVKFELFELSQLGEIWNYVAHCVAACTVCTVMFSKLLLPVHVNP